MFIGQTNFENDCTVILEAGKDISSSSAMPDQVSRNSARSNRLAKCYLYLWKSPKDQNKAGLIKQQSVSSLFNGFPLAAPFNFNQFVTVNLNFSPNLKQVGKKLMA